MCGISGIYSHRHSIVQPDHIRKMLTQIQYRGPDESGIFIGQGIGLGSVRLSIIDLQLGQQPMSDIDQEYWIVFNGEIFNYIELKEELSTLGYQFRTGSDTEVLLILYRHFREKCLEKLNGQFAFAIWDTNRKELFIARDRVGIRPLYYYNDESSFIFASEIKCILESEDVEPVLNPEMLNQVFTFWTIPSPGTMFKGIYEVPPGHYITIRDGHLDVNPFWELKFNPEDIREAISAQQINKYGIFRSDSVGMLLKKMGEGKPVTENENMAMAGILSTQILMDLFVSGNNPFRESTMRTDCPVLYDKSLKTIK